MTQTDSFPSALVRPATPQDAEAIGVLAQEFASYLRNLGDCAIFRFNSETYLRDGFGPSPAFFGLVAELNGKVVGFLLYHFGYDADRATQILHIVDLFVHEDHRRRGTGRALMAAAADIGATHDCDRLIWSVYIPNRDAFTFYESLGASYLEEMRIMYIPVPNE